MAHPLFGEKWAMLNIKKQTFQAPSRSRPYDSGEYPTAYSCPLNAVFPVTHVKVAPLACTMACDRELKFLSHKKEDREECRKAYVYYINRCNLLKQYKALRQLI